MSGMDANKLALDTLAIHAGQEPDPSSGAVLVGTGEGKFAIVRAGQIAFCYRKCVGARVE